MMKIQSLRSTYPRDLIQQITQKQAREKKLVQEETAFSKRILTQLLEQAKNEEEFERAKRELEKQYMQAQLAPNLASPSGSDKGKFHDELKEAEHK